MANKDYWKRRAEERKNRVSRTADEAAQEAKEAYERAKHRISKEVAYWIQQFADAEGITYEEARKLLESGELDEFRMTLEDYIAHGEQLGVDDSWLDAMIKASAIHHIDRLNALKLIIRAELEETKVKLQDAEWMHNLADYSFQQTLFTIETDQEVAIQFRLPDLETMHRDIEEAWAPDGMDFVTREGVNNDKLAAEVDRLITQACITGESYDDLAKQLEAQFDLKAYEAERIIRTESTRVASLSEAAAYKAAGIEEYEILVTLDERTCNTCGPMDGHVEKVENMEPGVTAPPFHPNCRCTTIGHYEDDLIDETRIARDEDGNPIHVDGDMTWEEWRAAYGGGLAISSPGSPKSLKNSLDGIRAGKAGLSEARKRVLEKIPESGSNHRFEKGRIAVRDLAYLSAATGHEFSLFRGKNEDILFHGTDRHCNISPEMADELIRRGYEWVAHSHVDTGPLVASSDDRSTLRKLGQKSSIIIGPDGRQIEFSQDDFA